MTGKQNSKGFILVFLGMLSAFGPFVMDMYLPTLPAMSDFRSALYAFSRLTFNVGFLPDYIFKSAVGAYYEYGGAGDRTIGFWSVK